MSIESLKRLGTFVLLCILQVVVFNHVHLFGIATPMLYLIFLMQFPYNYPRTGILLWCFALGFIIDMFGNTPGVASASLTLLAALHPYILLMFMPRDSEDDFVPSLSSLGVQLYFFYLLFITFIYCLLFFSLEMFNIAHWLYWLECVAGSTVLTVLLIFIVDIVWRRK